MVRFNAKQTFLAKAAAALDEALTTEIAGLHKNLIATLAENDVSLLQFTEAAIDFWKETLGVDRIFICDMRDGVVTAGWNKGKNIIKLGDWSPHYVPLDDDQTLQRALESDELVAFPVDGEGADLAFSIRLENGAHWLVVLDETERARVFSARDMAYIAMVRDLIVIKAKLAAVGARP